MQEEMNSAMASLNETIGADVPTFSEVEQKIQARYTRAKAMSELNDASVESRVLEVEQATANVEAQARLSQLRGELGLDAAPAAEPEPATSPRRRPSRRRQSRPLRPRHPSPTQPAAGSESSPSPSTN